MCQISLLLTGRVTRNHSVSGDYLTEAQSDLYNLIHDRFAAGEALTMRQMVEAMGCKSPAPVWSRLEHLQAKGAIKISECGCQAA